MIGCGFCSHRRTGYCARRDTTEPTGGAAFFGGPEAAGAYDGMQAEYVRVPYANIGCVKLPDAVTDDQAIMLPDIFRTAWFGAKLAEVDDGNTVAVFGAGPVGIFAVISAFLQGAGRIICVDRRADRLDMAREQGAEAVNFDAADDRRDPRPDRRRRAQPVIDAVPDALVDLTACPSRVAGCEGRDDRDQRWGATRTTIRYRGRLVEPAARARRTSTCAATSSWRPTTRGRGIGSARRASGSARCPRSGTPSARRSGPGPLGSYDTDAAERLDELEG